MGRKKLARELIGKKASRLLSFAKRKKSLIKSAHELSTLCGVEICMIIRNDECNDSDVWPPGPDTVSRMVKWMSFGQPNKYGLCDFYKEQREEVEKKIKKLREGDFDGLSVDELRKLSSSLNSKIIDVRERMTLMKASANPSIQEDWGNQTFDDIFNVEDLLKGEDLSVQETVNDEDFFFISDDDWFEGYYGMQPATNLVDLMEGSCNMPI